VTPHKITPEITLFYVLLFIGSLPGMLYGQSSDGKTAQVWSVDIRGNKTFSVVRIKSQIATEGYSFLNKLKFWNRSAHKLDKIMIKKDVIRIHDFYTRHGFPFVEVHYQIKSTGKQWKKRVIFTIHEKAPIRIKDIAFNFLNNNRYQKAVKDNKKFNHARKTSEYQEGRRYATIKQSQVIGSYTQALKNLGFAYAKVSMDAQVDTSRLAARLTFDIDLGPKTYIHHISVTGDSTVSDHYVIRESGLKKGQQYSLKALREASGKLLIIIYFSLLLLIFRASRKIQPLIWLCAFVKGHYTR
jgi:outer membrane protein assembly factor BamA